MVSNASKWVLFYDDGKGGMTFQFLSEPVNPYTTLAHRVADGLLTEQQAHKARVFMASEVGLVPADLDARIEWVRYVEQVRSNPSVLVADVDAGRRTLDDVARVRADLEANYPAEASVVRDDGLTTWAPPWPWPLESR